MAVIKNIKSKALDHFKEGTLLCAATHVGDKIVEWIKNLKSIPTNVHWDTAKYKNHFISNSKSNSKSQLFLVS